LPFTIRLLTARDAAAFKAFRLQSLRDAPDAFHSLPEEWDLPLETIVQRIEANRIFGAFDGGGAFAGIAMLALTARAIKQMRHKGEIWSVYVDPSARGKGLARQLMERCLAEARALGLEAVVLTASTHLTHVVELYESLGFTIYGTERGMVKLLDGRVIDDHLMELRLV
jgi:ribosomal protein S18 acetylase RimI-like enzyme